MEKDKKISKEFKFKDKDYLVLTPTLNIFREAKYKYAKKFTDLLKQGFLTKKKLESVLLESNPDLFEGYMNKRSELLQTMVELENLISDDKLPEDLEYIANMLKTYRNLLLQEDMSMTSIFENSADQIAEEERISYLIYNLIRNKDSSKIWKTDEEFQGEIDSEFVEACKYQIMCFDYKLDADWEQGLPETKALKLAENIRLKPKTEEVKDQQEQQEQDQDQEDQVPEVKELKVRKKRVKKEKVVDKSGKKQATKKKNIKG